ncbi:MAG: hypothetical protein LBH76_09145 [Propionibacteriaceae bacterium]|nr:hypothetical protein [Propionibacteriaceae bacterium]
MRRRKKRPARAMARMEVAERVEVCYNRERPHSAIGYHRPAQAMADHFPPITQDQAIAA